MEQINNYNDYLTRYNNVLDNYYLLYINRNKDGEVWTY